MTQEKHIETTIDGHAAEIKELAYRYGVTSVGIFGSTVRGEAHPDSDVDVLIEWPIPHTLFDRMDLAEKIETLLGRPVDVVLASRLHWTIREQVLQEVVWL